METAKLIDEEGWLHTGDVGAWTDEGSLMVIDRKKNFFKLSQGEFIAAEKLEVAYGQSPFVSQIYVYGDSRRSFLVAILVPEKPFLADWCLKNGITSNYFDQCKDRASEGVNGHTTQANAFLPPQRVKQALLEEFRNIAVVERFNKLEYIKEVYLHKEQLTIESGLVTPTMKVKVTSRKPLAGQFIITLIFFQTEIRNAALLCQNN